MYKISVDINGMTYNLKGDKDEKYLFGVANFVDNKIKEISSKKTGLSLLDSTVLAAVNITDELFECGYELENIEKTQKSVSEENSSLKSELNELKEKVEQLLKEKSNIEIEFANKEKELKERYKNEESYYNALENDLEIAKKQVEDLDKKLSETTVEKEQALNKNADLLEEMEKIKSNHSYINQSLNN